MVCWDSECLTQHRGFDVSPLDNLAHKQLRGTHNLSECSRGSFNESQVQKNGKNQQSLQTNPTYSEYHA